MRTAALGLIVLVALLHFYFLVLEMFLWRTRARRLFRMTAEKAEMTAQLAANQGLYNGFLATGLVWALVSGPGAARPARHLLPALRLRRGRLRGGLGAARPSCTCRPRRPRSPSSPSG